MTDLIVRDEHRAFSDIFAGIYSDLDYVVLQTIINIHLNLHELVILAQNDNELQKKIHKSVTMQNDVCADFTLCSSTEEKSFSMFILNLRLICVPTCMISDITTSSELILVEYAS